MKRKTLDVAFCVILLLLCLVPITGMLLLGPSTARANERLSAKPVLVGEDGAWNIRFLNQVSDYLADHFYPRQELITARNRVSALLNSSPEDDVIIGKNGWLYYALTLSDYTGTETMSERELFSAAHNLSLLQEYCKTQGVSFLFAVAPNKNSLYAENMPDYGVIASEHDTQQLFSLLNDQSVSYVDLFTAFESQNETLYFAHDSHWNSKGAALAADAINSSFSRTSSYFADDFTQQIPHAGDLFEMVYPTAEDGETDVVFSRGLNYERMGSEARPDSISIQTTSSGDGSLLAFRDSFGNSLYPYLADSFASCRFSRSTSYDLTQIKALGADYVLIELVERNLPYLITYLPVFPSPVREMAFADSVNGSMQIEADPNARAPEGLVLYRGELPTACDTDSSVYICCGDSSYEAFLLADGAFAAYLPVEALPSQLLYTWGGQRVSYDLIN